MNVNLNRKNITLKEIICTEYGQTKAESDLIVPDAKPDIAKILQICPRVAITQKNCQQNKAYIQGIIYVTVIYVPEDETKIKSMQTTIDFSHTVNAKDAEAKDHICAEAEIDSIDYSIVNSRKISLKFGIDIEVKVCRISAAALPTGIEDENIQTKTSPYRLTCSSPEEEQDFRFRDRLEIPSGKPDVSEIIKVSAVCQSDSIQYSGGHMNISGNIAVSALYLDSGEHICALEEALPFSETIEGLTLPDGECEGSYIIKEAECDVEKNPDGLGRIINLNFLICGTFCVFENIETNAICDAFGTEKPVNITKNSYKVETVSEKSVAQIAHKETVTIPDYLPEIQKMCDCTGLARITDISVDNGKIYINGEILSNIIYLPSDEGCPAGMSHISSFSQCAEFSLPSPDCICEAKAKLDHIGYNITSEKSFELRFIISLTVTVLKSNTVEIIDNIDIDEAGEAVNLPFAVVYFPEGNETVWDIAKRYSVTPETIIKCNSLSNETLIKGQKIHIFR